MDLEGSSETVSRRSGISRVALKIFRDHYSTDEISEEDVFYYVYGLLHCPAYIERYENNILRELPRIPCISNYETFRQLRVAGQRLGDLHVDYDNAEPYPACLRNNDTQGDGRVDLASHYRVQRMRFGRKSGVKDRSTIIYNTNISIHNIPTTAYNYIIDGKPAIEWVMDRQRVRIDKSSGIINDANEYANETVGDPSYPLQLLLRVITVSMQTMEVIADLSEIKME